MLKAIGLMSGTSLDGVDAALLETDGERVGAFGPALTRAYTPEERAVLRRALDLAATGEGEALGDAVRAAEAVLHAAHADAVRRLLAAADLAPGAIGLAGFHGQTILHRPAQRLTWQIGDGARLAHALGIDVIADFRTADVAAGGQGAPLVPLYHQALVRGLGAAGAVAVVNIGGVANVTWAGPDGRLLAFDTGPGNAAIDDWAERHTGQAIDRDGALARAGRVDPVRLAAMLDHPFFARPAPKSLDRMDFDMRAVEGLSPEDGAATLTAFTAASIACAAVHFPEPASRWLVCGGGRRNPVLMAELASRVAEPVEPVEAAGWRGDFLEAEAFAFLAVRAARGLPLSLPETTGVPVPMTGGRRFSRMAQPLSASGAMRTSR